MSASHLKFAADDPRLDAAKKAERDLFDQYEIEVTTHYIKLEEPAIRLRILEAGQGPPLIMVPGGPGNAWQWTPLIAHLQNHRIIAINRPGGGMSEGVDHLETDIRRLAADTISTVQNHFDLDRVSVVANSMGGLWTFWYALARPERVSCIVQLGTPALILGTSAPLPMRLQSIPLINQLLVQGMIPRHPETAHEMARFLGHPENVSEDWPDAMGACAYHFMRLPNFKTSWLTLMRRVLNPLGARMDVRFTEAELSSLKVPTLFIWGDRDPFGSLHVARRAAELARDAKLKEIGHGHLPWWDEPEECARLIQGFVQDHATEKE